MSEELIYINGSYLRPNSVKKEVSKAVKELVGLAPEEFDTIQELAGVMLDNVKDIKEVLEQLKDINVDLLVSISYEELKTLRDNSELVPGILYRITDYNFTTTEDDTKSAEHAFDIIVIAVTNNELSELARAIKHEGDTYFNNCNLNAWLLWYDLDNDTSKYTWADSENGKGVIYRMIDEENNDCPYDFKNALFYLSDVYYFTFTLTNKIIYDYTVVEKRICYGNSMKDNIVSNKKALCHTIFHCTSTYYKFINNKLGYNCRNNLFKSSCCNNTFENNCINNSIESGENNYFKNECQDNTLIGSNYNIFGSKSSTNIMTYSKYNIFGDNCKSNSLTHSWRNTFESYCYSNKLIGTLDYSAGSCNNNTFGKLCLGNILEGMCVNNTFGDNCNSNTLQNDCRSNTFGDNCYNNTLLYSSSRNIFRNHCSNNQLEHFCNDNTFENKCYNNQLKDNCSDNTFKVGCNSNTFETASLNDFERIYGKNIDSDNITITHNEYFYEDLTNKLVPIKHPDLSTQPAILPYKFMGNYVYELLIPVVSALRVQPLVDLATDKPAFLSANTLGLFATSNVDIQSVNNDFILLKDTLNPDVHKYIKITYTDRTQLIGSDGYGYSNSTGSSDIELAYDFGISSDTAWIYEKSSDTLTLNAIGQLTSNTIPSTYIQSKNIIIDDKVTNIGDYAFKGCTGLTSVTIPNSVTRIGGWAFLGCTGLTSVTIPNSVTSIGEYAFRDCTGLTAVHITDLAAWCKTRFSIGEANPLYCAHNLYLNGEKVTDLVIPEGVTNIEKRAFYKCTGLTSITIGEGVTSIELQAFEGCSGLTKITCMSITPPTIGDTTFPSKSIPVYVPVESVETYKAAQYWSDFTNIQSINEQ